MRSRKVLVGVVLLMLIVPGGVLLAFLGHVPSGAGLKSPMTQNIAAAPATGSALSSLMTFGVAAVNGPSAGSNIPLSPEGTVSSSTVTLTATSASQEPAASQPLSTSTNGTRDIEFFTNLTLQAESATIAFTKASAIAYSVGGYVSDSTESNATALVVMRVPAASDQQVLQELEGLGTLLGLSSSSNDVTVQYTDLNATLQSLQTEQASLLRILNESANINSTLDVETRLQGVDQQIDSVESQILQTQTLISYATISTTIEQKAPSAPLSIKLTATPRSGESPLSVTFNAVVKGGEQPYIVNYNFGDGSSYEGQSLIHTFSESGRYNVTVTATDHSANVTEAWTIVTVSPPPATSNFGRFPSFVGGLFLSVVEGIVEVAVVVVPIAGAVVVSLLPLRHRLWSSKRPQQTEGEESGTNGGP